MDLSCRRILLPHRQVIRSTFLLGIACALSSLAIAQRRDFPATYAVSHVSKCNSGVELTLTLTIRNFSDEDLENVEIALNGTGMRQAPIGSFAPVKRLPRAGAITVRHRFTVPEDEYVRWQQGIDPALEFVIAGGDETTRAEPIAARRETPLTEPAE